MKTKIIFFLLLFNSIISSAQCAMCRAVVEQSGAETAQGINNGIVYLMAFPYLVIGVGIFLLYRNWKKSNF